MILIGVRSLNSHSSTERHTGSLHIAINTMSNSTAELEGTSNGDSSVELAQLYSEVSGPQEKKMVKN